jgi:CHAT domain-containing protein/Tfp pilus assembly protein PilF
MQRERERPSVGVPVLALALLFAFLACNSRTPQSAFDQANRAFLHGDLAAAEEQAKKGYRDFHELGADWAWRFRILQGDVLMWRGLSQQVPRLFASEVTPTPAGALTIHRYRLEALAHVYEHRFQEAENNLHEAEKSCTTFHYSPCAEVISAWGGLEMERGHFVEAQRRFEQTLPLFRDDPFLEANALSSLGWSALQQEHFDEAIEWASRSYEQSTAIRASAIVQASLGNMGWAYYRLGEHEKALSMFIEAQKRAHESRITTDEVQWLTNAGYVYLDAGDYLSAERSYLQALVLAKDTGQEDRLNVLMSLALVCERSGKLTEARDYADMTIAMALPEGNPLDRLYPMLVKGHVAARMHDRQQAEKIYREIEQDPKSHVFLKWEAEHSLAQLYEDENQPQSADREYHSALSTFETARSSLKGEDLQLPFPSNALGIYDDYIHFLASQSKTAEALQVAEYSRGRTLAEGLGLLQKGTTFKPVALNPQEIARRAGGTILFYWLGEKQSYLWVITTQKTSLFTLPPKSEIDPVVRRYRKALSEQQEFLQTADDDARTLYRTLVMPAKSMLPENAKVIIIPDGSLNTLNLETLLVPDPTPHYWIEDVTVADANSLRLLTVPRSANRRNPNLLLLGNAVAPNTDYPELRKAAAEMESIAKNFSQPQQKIFARETATPTAYLSGKPEQFSYIHFVAHGTASRTSPLDSAIVLSKAGPEDDSFKLYARDIIHHPLHAELVTISTCYGAGARAYTGEGLVGLSWAFLRAGAHNVIGALWEVSDVSTPQLMDELYGQLAKGKTPDAALRNAKLKLLRSSTAFRKPFYWAPFQLYTGS